MLTTAIDRFKKYSTRVRAVEHEPEFVIEVDQRLAQLQFMVSRVRSLAQPTPRSDLLARAYVEDQYAAAPHLRQPQFTSEMRGLYENQRLVTPLLVNDIEIRVLTEAFYYCAARARSVIQDLPGLKSFEAVGVRDVRNKLLEHPEKDRDSGVIENGFSFDHSCGAVIKGVRRVDKVNIFPDKGLYVNAAEFATNLVAKIDRWLSS